MTLSSFFPKSARVAIIDIGSNSVRLVIFDRSRRDPVALYNEKVSCKLGQLDAHHHLRDEAKTATLTALRRFKMLLSDMNLDQVEAVATAGLRDAHDGKEFVQTLSEALGHPIRLISGEEEAELAAYGIVCGIPHANGFSGDLGGGSLELTPLQGGIIETGISLPLGILRLEEQFPFKHSDWHTRAEVFVHHALKQEAPFLIQGKERSFYTIGGSWRAFGSFCMVLYGYSLPVLHEYTLSSEQVLKACEILIQNAGSPRTSAFHTVPKKRWDELPYAAILLKMIMLHGGFDGVVISTTGVREGLIYRSFPDGMRQQDPLLGALESEAVASARAPELCPALYEWTSPLFEGDSLALNRLRLAICWASDLAWQYHPDYRARVATPQLLYGPWHGLCHEERVRMVAAIGYRYESKFSLEPLLGKKPFLLDEALIWSMRLGFALRLGYGLCEGSCFLLGLTRLEMESDTLNLWIDPRIADDMVAESVAKRLGKVAGVLDKKGRVGVG